MMRKTHRLSPGGPALLLPRQLDGALGSQLVEGPPDGLKALAEYEALHHGTPQSITYENRLSWFE
jgi:hypothetical protein